MSRLFGFHYRGRKIAASRPKPPSPVTGLQPSEAGAIRIGAAGALCKQERLRACAAVTPRSDVGAPAKKAPLNGALSHRFLSPRRESGARGAAVKTYE